LGARKLHDINLRVWLTGYLEACAAAGGKTPENAAEFLPWNMSKDSSPKFAWFGLG